LSENPSSGIAQGNQGKKAPFAISPIKLGGKWKRQTLHPQPEYGRAGNAHRKNAYGRKNAQKKNIPSKVRKSNPAPKVKPGGRKKEDILFRNGTFCGENKRKQTGDVKENHRQLKAKSLEKS